ncbi:MAG: sterol desaturase family protein [Bacteroidetes bacterium]|nr:sterol desaturase family protein [Bacteroidota bacterium]MBS1755741.1 sterol desaturase family protein [Bacteroidota bacterium]
MLGFINSKWVVIWSIPLTFLLIVAELYIGWRQQIKYYNSIDTRDNILLGILFAGVEALFGGVCLLMLFVFYHHGFQLAPHNILVYWLLLYLTEDLLYYWMHYLDHHIRVLWAGHITHHSSGEFNFSVGVRAALFEPVEKFIFFIPLAVIGFKPVDILLIYILSQTYGTLAHTRLIKNLGVLEYFFVTPSHHRVHHAKNVKYLDRNFGMTIIIWDKIFGTFQKEEAAEPIQFGIRKETPYKSFMDVVTNEIHQIIKDVRQPIPFKEKMKYIFGSPGYSHDGSRQTTKQLQKSQPKL